jgi:hypothetical protein
VGRSSAAAGIAKGSSGSAHVRAGSEQGRNQGAGRIRHQNIEFAGFQCTDVSRINYGTLPKSEDLHNHVIG